MKKYSCSIRPIIVYLATLLTPVLMTAQPMSVFDYLAVQDVSEVTITTDLTNLLELQGEEDQKAVLSFVNNENVTEEWDIKVSARGKFRRRICEFPPLKVDFAKGDLKNRGFAEFDKYKVVTHCQENRREAKEAVLREYTTYQMYNALTPSSYEAYLLQINYVDSKGEVNDLRRYAFILESTQELAARLAAEECEDCRGYTPGQVELPTENMLAVFQYMIGNTDFNLSMVRNLKLFSNDQGKAIPVAYDFDFSAMVSAPYAIPARDLGQTFIGDRVFLGFKVTDQLMEETLAHFEETREELEQIIKSQRALSSTARFEMRTYLDEFYEHLADLRELGKVRTYSQMRQTAPLVVPAGAKPEDYGVRR